MADYTPSKYQETFYKWMKQGQGNGVLSAVAGSGKTFTMVQGMRLLPPRSRVLSVAFNKHIAVEMGNKVPGNVLCQTINSFGLGIINSARRSAKPVFDQYKTDSIVKTYYNLDNRQEKNEFYDVRGAFDTMVKLLKAHLVFDAFDMTFAADIALKYGVELPEQLKPPEFYPLLREVYAKSLALQTTLDYNDQWFMPLYLDMKIPTFDWVFVDEAQDTTPAQIALIAKAGSRGRVAAIGDKNQSIYGFAGSDPDAMDKMQKALQAEVMPLSICYRCCRAVVREAQKFVPEIECAPDAVEGKVHTLNEPELMDYARDGDYALCRTTAPLVNRCMAFIARGQKAVIVGRDVGANLAAFLTKACKGGHFDGDVAVAVSNYGERLKRRASVTRASQVDMIDDKMLAIRAVLDSQARTGGGEDWKSVKGAIDRIFSDEDKTGVVFSTVHKAKGLEAERVFILKPGLMPHPMAKLPWEKEQERNIGYVARTRAKQEMIYLQEVDAYQPKKKWQKQPAAAEFEYEANIEEGEI